MEIINVLWWLAAFGLFMLTAKTIFLLRRGRQTFDTEHMFWWLVAVFLDMTIAKIVFFSGREEPISIFGSNIIIDLSYVNDHHRTLIFSLLQTLYIMFVIPPLYKKFTTRLLMRQAVWKETRDLTNSNARSYISDVRQYFQGIPADRRVLLTTIGLGILSACFNQLSSKTHLHYALLAMLVAIVSVIISISELIHRGIRERVKWMRRGTWWWFYHPSPDYVPFGTLLEIYGLIGGMSTCIMSIIQYDSFHREVDNPIKFYPLPVIFHICLLVSILRKA